MPPPGAGADASLSAQGDSSYDAHMVVTTRGHSTLWIGACVGLAAGAALVHGAGCLDNGPARPAGSRCGDASDCAPGLVCVYGRCRGPCSIDADCPGGLCIRDGSGGRVCVLPEDLGCEGDGCAPVEIGDGGRLVETCSTTDECPADFNCDGRHCVLNGADGDADADADGDGDIDADTDADGDADAPPPCDHPVCDLWPPCGCSDGQGCREDRSGTRTCVAVGDVPHGGSCPDSRRMCVSGTTCMTLSSDPESWVHNFCAQYCDDDRDCASLGPGSACSLALFAIPPEVKTCTVSCDLITGDGCRELGLLCLHHRREDFDVPAPWDTGCYVIAGNALAGEPCETYSDCATNLFCGPGLPGRCLAYCLVGVPGSCPLGSCLAFSGNPSFDGQEYGYCLQ